MPAKHTTIFRKLSTLKVYLKLDKLFTTNDNPIPVFIKLLNEFLMSTTVSQVNAPN